jgi:hypothetical protein
VKGTTVSWGITSPPPGRDFPHNGFDGHKAQADRAADNPGIPPGLPFSSHDAVHAEPVGYYDAITHVLDRLIGTHLYEVSMDLHTALATADPDDLRASLYLALRRLDDAITEVQAALHTSSPRRQRNSI